MNRPMSGYWNLSIWTVVGKIYTFYQKLNSFWLIIPRGIEVFSTLEKLEKLINEYTEGLIEKSYKEIGDAMKNSSMVNCNEKNRLIELTAVEDACAPPKADIAE